MIKKRLIKVSRRLQRKWIKEVSNRFDVDVEFVEIEDECSGQANVDDGVVELSHFSLRKTEDNFLSTLLHEAAHIWAYRRGIFDVFHGQGVPEYMTTADLKVYISTAWRAERWVEKKAKEWMNEFYPGHLYWFSYGRLKGRALNKDWFDKAMVDDCRKELRRRKLRAIDREQRKLKK